MIHSDALFFRRARRVAEDANSAGAATKSDAAAEFSMLGVNGQRRRALV